MSTISSKVSLGLAIMLTTTVGCFAPKWGPASADPSVMTVGPATYAKDSGVTEAVHEKCKVDRDLAKAIAQRSPVPVALTEDPQVTLYGEIIQDGVVQASFTDKRSTMRSVGTCKMLDHVTTAISKDVKKWLKKPGMAAQLGELK
jgi:hypothetical protein